MAYANNKFCWHGIITTDVDAAKAFYTETIGWGIETVPMGDDTATMVTAGGSARAHIMLPPMDGVPPHISSYLRVEDVDASLAAAVEAGGTALSEPTDIPPGRFVAVASPTGAAFLLFREADPSAENKPDGPGAIHWVELHSTDVKSDLAWLEKSFGITTEEMPMPDGPYFILKSGDDQVGGAMSAMMPGVPSNWLVWLNTPGVDDCAARIKSNGGQILTGPMEVDGIGKMYVAMDPAGAAFGIIEPPAA